MHADDDHLWPQLEPLLDQALELEPAEREDYLRAACGGDAALLAAARRLLAASERAGPLDRPLPDLAGTLARGAGSSVAEPNDRRVGSWRLIEPIGSGGMGRVYRAERIEGGFDQVVALKLLRWELADAALVQRFERERQILADLDHPGIARLIDGGLGDEGLPYLVMEYVDGRPIDEVADELPVRAQLELFLEVASAVQHAHRRLVVHRDLKPSNILVTSKGRVKLLDFGVAKILDETGAADATQTRLAMATPLFAAPEQLRGGAITTATDVWAMGVLLYRMLTGHLPFQGNASQFTDLVRSILEDEPPRPSERRDAVDRSRLQGDLDTIVLEALRKEPDRRYGTVEALANDVRRHLEGQPITARPSTVAYRARKFVARHRIPVVATTVVVLVIVGLVGFYTDRLARERDRLAQQVRTTEEVKGFVLSLFEVNDPSISGGEEITARELLDRGGERIPLELSEQPVIQAEMHDVVASLYDQLGLYDRSDEHYARAVELWREHRGARSAEVANSLARRGFTLQELGDYALAESLSHEALDILRIEGDDAEVASAANQLGMLLSYKGDYDEAEALLRESAERFERVNGRDDPRRATALSNLGLTVKWAGRMDEAEPIYREALRVRRAVLVDHPDIAVTLDNLGVLLGQRGDYEESERLFREALELRRRVLGDDHPDVALNLNNLATLFRVQNRLDEAEPIYRQVVELNRAVLGPDHPRVATNLVNLGSVEMARGQTDAAIALFEEGLRIRVAALGEEHVEVANALSHLVQALLRAGRLDEARGQSERAVGIARGAVGESSPQLASALNTHAEVLRRLGRPREAVDVAREALSIRENVLASDHWETAQSRGLLGRCLVDLDETDAAIPLLESSYEVLLDARGSEDAGTVQARDALIAAYEAEGRTDDAAALRPADDEGDG